MYHVPLHGKSNWGPNTGSTRSLLPLDSRLLYNRRQDEVVPFVRLAVSLFCKFYKRTQEDSRGLDSLRSHGSSQAHCPPSVCLVPRTGLVLPLPLDWRFFVLLILFPLSLRGSTHSKGVEIESCQLSWCSPWTVPNLSRWPASNINSQIYVRQATTCFPSPSSHYI